MSDARYTRAIARALRGPLLDYQDAAAAALNGDGAPWPPVVVLLAPRQTGKTSTILKVALGRGAWRRDYRAAYTAQRGTVVTERFTGDGDGWISALQTSPLARRYRYRRTAGNERITNKTTGSFLRGFPPVDGALRSLALDLVVVDEAQEHKRETGEALDATIVPTFSTRPLRQLVVTGTAGGPGWWRDYYDRAAAGEHVLVEIGTWPDDADPDDEQTWLDHHPGLRAGLTDLPAMREARRILGRDRFAREYGNRWDDHAGAEDVIPLEVFDDLPARPVAAGGRRVAAFDVTLDRGSASVALVTGRHLQLVAQCHPTDLPAVLRRVGVPVWAPPGQAGIAARLRAAGITADTITGEEYRAGCQQFLDAVLAGDELTHDHQAELRAAFDVAERSWAGDTWALSARRSGGDITAAVAAIVAWRAAVTHREPVLV